MATYDYRPKRVKSVNPRGEAPRVYRFNEFWPVIIGSHGLFYFFLACIPSICNKYAIIVHFIAILLTEVSQSLSNSVHCLYSWSKTDLHKRASSASKIQVKVKRFHVGNRGNSSTFQGQFHTESRL